jgi:hypothetical protein
MAAALAVAEIGVRGDCHLASRRDSTPAFAEGHRIGFPTVDRSAPLNDEGRPGTEVPGRPIQSLTVSAPRMAAVS